ncbi:MAG TPA: hypothetical protein VEW42_01780 [Candidatus Eisenbacteria bacterium]|nr:hypothetical protein [Candidatus Eisenbacteria bacterium]
MAETAKHIGCQGCRAYHPPEPNKYPEEGACEVGVPLRHDVRKRVIPDLLSRIECQRDACNAGKPGDPFPSAKVRL